MHQAVKKNARSVGADVSEKVFEQHVDFFRVHVLAHVFDPHDRDVSIPKASMSHTIDPRELRPTHWTQSSTLLTLFQTSLRIGSTLSAAGLLSQHTVPKEAVGFGELSRHSDARGALRSMPLYNLSKSFDVLGRGGCVNVCEIASS